MAEYLKCDLSDVGLISSALYMGVVASSLICPFLFAKL
jgi:predicted MFS family arabinose efflux permease